MDAQPFKAAEATNGNAAESLNGSHPLDEAVTNGVRTIAIQN
jgi:hypothetical protein